MSMEEVASAADEVNARKYSTMHTSSDQWSPDPSSFVKGVCFSDRLAKVAHLKNSEQSLPRPPQESSLEFFIRAKLR